LQTLLQWKKKLLRKQKILLLLFAVITNPCKTANMPVFDKVLLVEDDPITILVCKRTIEIAGFANTVTSVVNGQEAIDYLTGGNDVPDLILLDLNMPILNGWEFLEWFTTWAPSAEKMPAVYILSSTVDPEDQKKAMEYPTVKGFISKPLTKDHLAGLGKEYGAV